MIVENRFMVGVMGNQMAIMLPPRGYMSKEEAINLAAWLVAVTETIPGGDKFEDVLKAVQNT